MTPTISPLVRKVLGLSAEAFPALAASRFGAQDDMDRTWRTFEPVAATLVDTFYATIDDPAPAALYARLEHVTPELRGIAYEGAGMGLAFLDGLLPTRNRLAHFVNGPGAHYRALMYIGAGLVQPRLPRSTRRYLATIDPFHRWYVMDGYGFYEGFFNWEKTIRDTRGSSFDGYAARAYDQGLGRSLWFSTGANVERIVATVATFPEARQPDLWSGLGLACAYAAGVMDRAAITTLVDAAGPYAPDLATGAAVASTFRGNSGQPAPHTDLACDVIWNQPSHQVAALACDCDQRRTETTGPDSYRIWRENIRATWADPVSARPAAA